MIVVLNLMIGLTTPPMGVCLLVVLMLVTYVPQISLFLPNLLFNR